MSEKISPEGLRKAPVASACFMGLGQILYLKKYVRGAFLMLFELAMLFLVLFQLNPFALNCKGPIVQGIAGFKYFATLASNPTIEERNAAVGIIVRALFTVLLVVIFGFVYYKQIKKASEDVKAIIEKGDYLTKTEQDLLDIDVAPFASKCFMGLGQIIYLKQYYRGAVLALSELAMLFLVIFQYNPFAPTFLGPIVTNIIGLFTLGDPHPELGVKFRDHSIFMMIDGLMILIVVGLFAVLYLSNVTGQKKDIRMIKKYHEFPSMKQTRNNIAQNSFAVIGITPCVIMIAFFTVVPLLFSALVAFTNYSSPDHIPPNNLVDWVGGQNFVTMFNKSVGGAWTSAFGRTALWTVIWAVFSTFTCFFAGFFFAVVLQDKRVKMPKIYRTIFILPYAIPTMLSLFIWANLLNGTFGPVNRTLMYFEIIKKAIPWLSDPTMAKVTLILVNIWIGFPYSMILTTSSMTAISNSLYEAATIDGANKWQQFKSITFPLVAYQLKPILIMQFAGNINNFGAVFFLTGGGPNMPDTISTQAGATDLLISWIYKLTMNTPNMYNLASVLSILVFVVLVPFALYNFTRTKSFKESEI